MKRKSLNFSTEQLWLLYDALGQACDCTYKDNWNLGEWIELNKLHDRIRDAYVDSFDNV